jgi:hypothetical protein
MDSNKARVNYVEEKDLQEDVRTLYATGEFPDRLSNGLVKMVDGVLRSRRFHGYSEDWKEEMRSNALAALVSTLHAKRYDNTRPNTKFFSWATRVIFNQFHYYIDRKKREERNLKQYIDERIADVQD